MKSSRLSCATAIMLAGLACGSGKANDSTARLDTGGLSLTHNPSIEMQEEDLYLSAKEVRVRYRFFNKSSSDIETLVAFPLPEIETGEGGNYNIESVDPVNFVDFRVSVDGTSVKPSVEARASSMGVDITPLLAKYGLPITTITENDAQRSALYARLDKLPEAALRELERYGAIDRLSSSSKDGTPDVNPRWTAHITFYWFQTFPAGRPIEVTHRYKPVLRNFFSSLDEIGGARMRKDYCVNDAFLKSARRMERGGTLTGLELRYVVSTAQNWSGPIGTFRLTVDKGAQDRIVSTCFEGLKPSGPATFIAQKKDFQAADDLGVLLIWNTPNPK